MEVHSLGEGAYDKGWGDDCEHELEHTEDSERDAGGKGLVGQCTHISVQVVGLGVPHDAFES